MWVGEQEERQEGERVSERVPVSERSCEMRVWDRNQFHPLHTCEATRRVVEILSVCRNDWATPGYIHHNLTSSPVEISVPSGSRCVWDPSGAMKILTPSVFVCTRVR